MRQCLGYLQKNEAQKDRLETVLYNLIDSISKGAELLSSFMPETAEKILAQLNGGNVTDKPEILFQRLDLEEVIKKSGRASSTGRGRKRRGRN